MTEDANKDESADILQKLIDRLPGERLEIVRRYAEGESFGLLGACYRRRPAEIEKIVREWIRQRI